ncbi:MAG: tetraacyldisaccharide 4'-kinase [Mesorhizobium sp.]
MSSAPPFWWEKAGWQAIALLPVSAIYGSVAARRLAHAKRENIDAPVICVGNFTVGGTGKTPTVIALAQAAVRRGMNPGILSRGHGGRGHARIVDLESDSAAVVGDEPLLLARHAPVAVARKRAEGAALLVAQGCDLILMDDGFQSSQIRIDHALLVIDARTGIGNGHIIPGGPLRAPVIDQIRFSDSLLRIGEGTASDAVVRMAARAGKPVYDARTVAIDALTVSGKRVLAFAGIGHPERFYDALSAAGANVVETRSFDDHHQFKPAELTELERDATRVAAQLITTEKDAARMQGGIVPSGFLDRLAVFAIETRFEPENVPDRIIDDAVASWRKRRF